MISEGIKLGNCKMRTNNQRLVYKIKYRRDNLMKTTLFFLAFSFAVLLTSCSQVDQESSPLSPQINKNINQSGLTSFPYKYLSEFPELETVKWEESLSDDQWVIVTLKKQSTEFHHIFCEVIYTDFTEADKKSSELFFAGKPEKLKFVFSKPSDKSISGIRVYGVYNYPTANDIQYNNEVYQFPYNYWQIFNSVTVNSWTVKENTVSVNASNELNYCEYIFAQINSKEGNKLVFAARPSSEFFDIPKYGDTGIEELNLYGLNVLRTNDIE
jgi:hypothetical protein